MSSSKCLNCDNEITAKFCSNCGQKADTHRITPKHFIMHDLLHGVFHLDKGIWYTIKQTLSRPGKSANDYISGKRVNYYNIFYLSLILLGLNILLVHFAIESQGDSEKVMAKDDGQIVWNFLTKNAKYIILTFIPLFALNGLMIFRRRKYNIAEHHIVAGFTLLGCTIFAIIFNLAELLYVYKWAEVVAELLQWIVQLGIVIYIVFVYYTAFGNLYSKAGFSWRMFLMLLLFIIEAIILLASIIAIISHGHFQGEINLG